MPDSLPALYTLTVNPVGAAKLTKVSAMRPKTRSTGELTKLTKVPR